MNTKRNRMPADARKTAILEAASQLLTERPWGDVTVSDLLDAAGISKGGFYHHFTSREDVLAAVVLRLADDSIAVGQDTLSRVGGDPVERFSAFMTETARWELSHARKILAIVRMAMMEGNGPLFIKLGEESQRRCAPIIRSLIEDGDSKSAFDVVDLDQTTELLMQTGRMRWPTFLRARDMADGGDREEAWRVISDRVRVEEALTNRLLGLQDRTVRFPPLHEYRPLIAQNQGPA